MTLTVYLRGYPVDAFGQVSDLKYSKGWPGGCLTCSFNVDLPPTFNHYSAIPGGSLEVYDGPRRVWLGITDEPTRGSPWSFTGSGRASLGSGFAAIRSSDGQPTQLLSEAIPYAITRGLPWIIPSSYPTATLPQAATDLGDLLTQITARQTPPKRWGVDEQGRVIISADPTAITYLIVAADGFGGRDISDYYSKVSVQFVDEDLTAAAPMGTMIRSMVSANAGSNVAGKHVAREKVVDVTGWGPIDKLTVAQPLANAIAATVGAQAAYTGSMTVAPGEIQDRDGNDVWLPSLEAGRLYRTLGVQPDPASGNMFFDVSVDVLIGQVDYDGETGLATLTPMAAKERDLEGLISGIVSFVGKKNHLDPLDEFSAEAA